jgi:ligand-binding SRPBCC domain-containing protein
MAALRSGGGLMLDHIVERRLLIGRGRPEVFAFLADPHRASRLLPPWLRVQLLTDSAVPVGAGTVLDFRVACLGLSFAWRAFVREFDPPFRFLDVQLRGPFARWEHRHRFLAVGDATLMEDRLVYRLPLGVAGRAAHAVVVARLMAAAWRYRTRRIGMLLGPVDECA